MLWSRCWSRPRTARQVEPAGCGGHCLGLGFRVLPGRSDAHQYGTVGCVLSDGRFAVFGGVDDNGFASWSCAALNIDADGARWSPFLPMHEPRLVCACAAIGGGPIIVAGSGV